MPTLIVQGIKRVNEETISRSVNYDEKSKTSRHLDQGRTKRISRMASKMINAVFYDRDGTRGREGDLGFNVKGEARAK